MIEGNEVKIGKGNIAKDFLTGEIIKMKICKNKISLVVQKKRLVGNEFKYR